MFGDKGLLCRKQLMAASFSVKGALLTLHTLVWYLLNLDIFILSKQPYPGFTFCLWALLAPFSCVHLE